MVPTTENAYQQTELIYRPTTESFTKKIKNPLKVPSALLNPDRSVSYPKQKFSPIYLKQFYFFLN